MFTDEYGLILRRQFDLNYLTSLNLVIRITISGPFCNGHARLGHQDNNDELDDRYQYDFLKTFSEKHIYEFIKAKIRKGFESTRVT